MNYGVSNSMIVWTGGGQQSFGIPGKNVHSATGFRVVVGGYRQLLVWHWSQRGIQCCSKKLGYWVTTVTFICMSSMQTVWCNTFFFFFTLPLSKPLYNQSEKTQFSQMTCGCQAIVDQSIGLCDWGLTQFISLLFVSGWDIILLG